jgi:hypothetical protein
VVEQAMRFVVIDRHVTQGTRSARGQEICERLWTVMGNRPAEPCGTGGGSGRFSGRTTWLD